MTSRSRETESLASPESQARFPPGSFRVTAESRAAASARDRDQAEQAGLSTYQWALILALLYAQGESEDSERVRRAAGKLGREAAAWSRRLLGLIARSMGRSTGAARKALDGLLESRGEALGGELADQALERARKHYKGMGDELPEKGDPDADAGTTAKALSRAAATAAMAREQIDLAGRMTETGGVLEGADLRKIWVSRGDHKVRMLHRRLHGDNRRMGDDFWRWPASGEVLAFPGDPSAPLEATANCRCFLWFAPAGELAEAEPPPLLPADLEESFDLARA